MPSLPPSSLSFPHYVLSFLALPPPFPILPFLASPSFSCCPYLAILSFLASPSFPCYLFLTILSFLALPTFPFLLSLKQQLSFSFFPRCPYSPVFTYRLVYCIYNQLFNILYPIGKLITWLKQKTSLKKRTHLLR